MKHLIIYSHLNPKSFTKAIVDQVEKTAKAKGDEVKIIDLYGEKFNPILEFPDIQYMFMGGDAPEDVKKISRFAFLGRPFYDSLPNVVGANACNT